MGDGIYQNNNTTEVFKSADLEPSVELSISQKLEIWVLARGVLDS